jgi:hypothetical protein
MTLLSTLRVGEGGGESDDDWERRMDEETDAVMKERVKTSTREGYTSRNVTFMIWLFDSNKYHDLINADVLELMTSANRKDKDKRTKKGKPTKKRDELRGVCAKSLEEKEPPIKVESLTFQIFSRYLTTFKKSVATKRKSPTVSEGTEAEEDGNVRISEKTTIRLASSSYSGACSALSYLFTEAGISKECNETTRDLWLKLSQYNKGSRRLGGKEKRSLGISTEEGKRPLTLAAYKHLAKVLFESDKPEHVGAHAFLILAWNLISRAEFVIGSNIDAIWWHGDAIMFDVGATKTDPEGTRNIDHPWHIYANNEDPFICPVLALSRYLIDHPDILAGKCPLFEGSGQYDRYSNILSDVMSSTEHRDKFISLGMVPEHFGTHSIRKGAVTHISTGTTSCPPIASICIRANWNMPGVMDRYIKYENAGDQFVGKCVSGRTRLSKEFAASPAYFDFSKFDRVESQVMSKEVDKWIRDRLPADAKRNSKVFALFKMCIASMAHNRQFLSDHLHTKSKLRLSRFLTDDIPHSDCVTIRYPWNKTTDTPEITGIPPDVLILSEFEDMRQHFRNLEESMKTHFNEALTRELNNRDVGGSSYSRMTEMMDKMESMMDRLNARSLPLNTTTNETESEIVNDYYNNECYVEDDDDIVLTVQGDVDEATLDKLRAEQTKKALKARTLSTGFHHGHFNPLPSTWVYPTRMTIIDLINLWLLGGGKDTNVPPFRLLSPINVKHFDAGGKRFSKFKQVMKFVERFGREKDAWLSKTERWDGKAVTDLWDAIWDDFKPYMTTKTQLSTGDVSEHKSRTGEIAAITVYKKLVQAGEMQGNKRRKTS